MRSTDDSRPSATTSPLSSSEDCVFCRIGSGFGNEAPPSWDVVLCESENFFVVPSKGALTAGWLLIVPRSHYISLGVLSGSEVHELRALLQEIGSLLAEQYCSPTVFEHGPSNYQSALGCGVNHAHLHAVPLPFSLETSAISVLGDPVRIPASNFWSNPPLYRLHQQDTGYLWLLEPGKSVLAWTDPPESSQFFRKLIARGLGVPEQYDYREFPFENNVQNTIRHIRQEFHRSRFEGNGDIVSLSSTQNLR